MSDENETPNQHHLSWRRVAGKVVYDQDLQFAADAKECAMVHFAGFRIPLPTFNSWIRSPQQFDGVLGSLRKLQRQMTENLERHRGHRTAIRGITEKMQRVTNREAIHQQYLSQPHEVKPEEMRPDYGSEWMR